MQNTTNLTHEDLNLLIDAVKEWTKAPINKAMPGQLMGAILDGLLPDEKLSREERQRITKQKLDTERAQLLKEEAVREEQATLLLAKLITLRREFIG